MRQLVRRAAAPALLVSAGAAGAVGGFLVALLRRRARPPGEGAPAVIDLRDRRPGHARPSREQRW